VYTLELLESRVKPDVPLMERYIELLHLLKQLLGGYLVNIVAGLILLGVDHFQRKNRKHKELFLWLATSVDIAT